MTRADGRTNDRSIDRSNETVVSAERGDV